MNIKKHTFKFRTGDTDEKGGCTFIGGSWKDINTHELFSGKKVLLFSLPGAFTPTCSGEELPTYDEMYSQFKDKGIDDVYCISVNDAFVMNAWARDLGIKNVKFICQSKSSVNGSCVIQPGRITVGQNPFANIESENISP